METVQLHLHIQATLVDLVYRCKLKGQYYWPHVLGMLKDPNWHYVRSLHTISTKAT